MSTKILLVDDQQTVLQVEQMMLKETGASIVIARNGIQALEVARTERPDLIVLDIMMPEMDGIETCQNLKSNPETLKIPVVMVTTKGNPEKVEEAFRAGCNDFVTKPINKVVFLDKIRSCLNGQGPKG